MTAHETTCICAGLGGKGPLRGVSIKDKAFSIGMESQEALQRHGSVVH